MVRPKPWRYGEKCALVENYNKLTIKELMDMFPNRSAESINNKIKRLKRNGEIVEGKDGDAVARAYKQRGDKGSD